MKKQRTGILRVGTSNIVLPGNKQTFPSAYQHTSRLHYYGSLFNTLEVNSSFYKVPMASTFEKWAGDVPENFRFTLKLWREVTHSKPLGTGFHHISAFMEAAGRIGQKKGCILVQFPGKITLQYFNEVALLLQGVKATDPNAEWKIAVEFRSPTWYAGETYELMDEVGASMVLHDIPGSKNREINRGARFVYARFHGPAGDYRGGYSDVYLQDKAAQVQQWLNSGLDVYAYFNNTIGSAFENAMKLKALAGE